MKAYRGSFWKTITGLALAAALGLAGAQQGNAQSADTYRKSDLKIPSRDKQEEQQLHRSSADTAAQPRQSPAITPGTRGFRATSVIEATQADQERQAQHDATVAPNAHRPGRIPGVPTHTGAAPATQQPGGVNIVVQPQGWWSWYGRMTPTGAPAATNQQSAAPAVQIQVGNPGGK